MVADLAFQLRDLLGIESALRACTLASKCRLAFGSPLAFPGLQSLGTELIHASHLRDTLSGVDLPHHSYLQLTGILLSGHQHGSPPFNVAGPLISCLTFGVHSIRLPRPPRFRLVYSL